MRLRKITLLLAALSAPPQFACAEGGPLLAPSRDVAVLYRLTGAAQQKGAEKLQVTYADRGQRVRMDYFRYEEAKYPFGSLIYDGTADRVFTVLPQQRTYVEIPAGRVRNPSTLLDKNMQFKRRGTAVIAGLTCVDWQVVAGNRNAVACVMDDGLVLRVVRTGADQGAMEAVAVEYTPRPPEVFRPPSDFRAVTATGRR